jgi:hypothetical protein
MKIPEGWTDDMNIPVTDRRVLGRMVDMVLGHFLSRRPYEEAFDQLVGDFNLTDEDAELAMDRIQGGVIRALTGNRKNRPDRRNEPLARISFDRVWSEFPREHLFSFGRVPQGRWVIWRGETAKRRDVSRE